MKKIKLKRLHLIIALLIICFSIPVFKIVYVMFTVKTTRLDRPIPAYHDLFTDEAKQKMHFYNAITSNVAEPSSLYEYDSLYKIIVFSVVLKNNHSLNDIIKYKNIKSGSMDAVFSSGGDSRYEVKMTSEKVEPVNIVHLNFQGSSIDSFSEGHNIFYSSLVYDNFSISFDDKGNFYYAKAQSDEMPSSVAFIKKGNYLYLVIMSLDVKGDNMPPKLLYDLIKK